MVVYLVFLGFWMLWFVVSGVSLVVLFVNNLLVICFVSLFIGFCEFLG